MLRERLARHHLAGIGLPAPEDVVRWFGAVQAQDFAGALWAVGQRVLPATTETAVLAAFDAGAVIRTHVLRPTWHFVAPEDLRWMLALTAPRIQATAASRYTELGLDGRSRLKAERAFARALAGGRQLTRQDLAAALQGAGVATDGQRLVHLLMHAELQALICSGPRVGKQLTYALVDDRVPATSPLPREDMLATLFTRYFTSHGPATRHDAGWWSGLPLGDVRAGIALAGDALQRRMIDGREYWSGSNGSPAVTPVNSPSVHFLPSYDEYTVAYRDRAVLLHASTKQSSATQMALLSQPVLLNGTHVGDWTRTVPPRISAPARIEVRLLQPLTRAQARSLEQAVARYAAYLGRPLTFAVK
jgi:Winged helix DNA-binding domain